MRITRRRFIGSMLGAVPCGIGYVTLLEPNWIDVTRTTIRIGPQPLPRPVRLLHLSDLHVSGDVPASHIVGAIALGLAEKPDLVCLTGDFISGRLEQQDAYAAALAKLPAAVPTFAVLGNHDGGEWHGRRGGYETTELLRGFLARAGIRVLHNATADLDIGGTVLRLTGLGDLWAGECRPAAAFRDYGLAAPHARIVLAHNPDTKDDLKNFRWDLMLSGHTHGGQVELPFLHGLFAPVRDHRFIAGRYDWEDRQIYITRGIGSLRGIRFNCRPEVSLLTLV